MENQCNLYPVEKIVGKRMKRGKVQYLVRWKNYSPETDSWEPSTSLKETCYPLIKMFNHNLRLIKKNNRLSTTNNKFLDLSKTSLTNNDLLISDPSSIIKSKKRTGRKSKNSSITMIDFRKETNNLTSSDLILPETCAINLLESTNTNKQSKKSLYLENVFESSNTKKQSKKSLCLGNELESKNTNKQSKKSLHFENVSESTNTNKQSKKSLSLGNELENTNTNKQSKKSLYFENVSESTNTNKQSKKSLSLENELESTNSNKQSKKSLYLENVFESSNTKKQSSKSLCLGNELESTNTNKQSKKSLNLGNELENTNTNKQSKKSLYFENVSESTNTNKQFKKSLYLENVSESTNTYKQSKKSSCLGNELESTNTNKQSKKSLYIENVSESTNNNKQSKKSLYIENVSKSANNNLENGVIENHSSQATKHFKLDSLESCKLSSDNIQCTFYYDENTKTSSPRTSFNSMSTEKTINSNEKQTKPTNLKRKNSINFSVNHKKLKISSSITLTDNSIHTFDTLDFNGNVTKPLNIKTSMVPDGIKVTEMKLDKCLKRLPYQKHKDCENMESVEPLVLRRKSARQRGAANRFREIIVRKNTAARYTEISLYNNKHSQPNCFTVKMLNELSAALKQAMNDSSRVLLLSAAGKVFSCGIDLESIVHNVHGSFNHLKNAKSSTAQLANPVSHNQYLLDLAESLKRFLLQLLNFPKPIVVGINGPAIGLGCAIIPLCDLIYATESSSFYLPYTSLSQFPEGGTSVTLSMFIGMPAANQLLLGGRKWSAREALNRGLISEIIFSEKFKVELFSRCKKLANVPSMSLETMKCMLRFQFKEKIEFSINVECRKLLEIWRTTEFQNNAQYFIEKTLPDLLS